MNASEIELLKPTKVLLVDDYGDLAEVTKLLLQHLGFNVKVAQNGRECIALTEICCFDVILMDIDMPVMDGLTVCKFIRQQLWGKNLPIIALTARREESTEQFKEAGFDFHLVKPVDYQDLAAVIVNAILLKKHLQ